MARRLKLGARLRGLEANRVGRLRRLGAVELAIATRLVQLPGEGKGVHASYDREGERQGGAEVRRQIGDVGAGPGRSGIQDQLGKEGATHRAEGMIGRVRLPLEGARLGARAHCLVERGLHVGNRGAGVLLGRHQLIAAPARQAESGGEHGARGLEIAAGAHQGQLRGSDVGFGGSDVDLGAGADRVEGARLLRVPLLRRQRLLTHGHRCLRRQLAVEGELDVEHHLGGGGFDAELLGLDVARGGAIGVVGSPPIEERPRYPDAGSPVGEHLVAVGRRRRRARRDAVAPVDDALGVDHRTGHVGDLVDAVLRRARGEAAEARGDAEVRGSRNVGQVAGQPGEEARARLLEALQLRALRPRVGVVGARDRHRLVEAEGRQPLGGGRFGKVG